MGAVNAVKVTGLVVLVNQVKMTDSVVLVNKVVRLFAQKTFDKFIPVEGDQESIRDSL